MVAERTQVVSQHEVTFVYDKKETDVSSLVLAIVGLAGSIILAPFAPIWLLCSIVGLVRARRRSAIRQTTAAFVVSIIGIVLSTLETCFIFFYTLILIVVYPW
ncbi:MAG: hypothetical protein FWF98_02175 [Dehalococcoidia bacterium]|nr:hypothetical protein [Dehalococcoidia bacterium]